MSYTPPDIGNISFILGDGSLTSPFVDIIAPLPVVDGESTTDIYLWGDVNQPVAAVIAEAVTPIICDGAVGFPSAPAMHSEVFTYKLFDFAVEQPGSEIAAEATTEIIISGQFVQPKGRIDSRMSDEATLTAPMSTVEAVAVTPIIGYGAIKQAKPSLSGEAVIWLVADGDLRAKGPKIAANCGVDTVAYGDMSQPVSVVSAYAQQTETMASAVSQRMAVLKGEMSGQDSYEVIRYEEA
jgi:hypothetical protein